MFSRYCRCLMLCAALAASSVLQAHDAGLSRGDLRISGERLELRLAFHESDVRLALGVASQRSLADPMLLQVWQQKLAANLRLTCSRAGRDALPLQVSTPVADQGNGLATVMTGSLAGCRDAILAEPLLGALLPGHRQVLIVTDAAGKTITHLLSALSPELRIAAGDVSPGSGWRAMVGEGVHHILIGYDHLAFLAVLLIAVLLRARADQAAHGRTLRQLLVVISAFTLAHSLTLGLAATGVVTVPAGWIEAVIALSVVIGGVLNLAARPGNHGAALAFGFGLVHGFGFASAFAGLAGANSDVGWLAVVQFNLGVELGQLAVGLPVFALGLYVMNRLAIGPRLVRSGSLAAALAGGVWFVERLAAV